MKNLHNKAGLLVATLIIALAFSACKKLNLGVTIPLKVANIDFVIDTTSHSGNMDLTATVLQSKLDSVLQANNVKTSKVQSIEMKTLTFTITDSTNTFDILDNVQASMAAPNLPDVQIASKNSIAHTGMKTLDMNVDGNTNLMDYFNASQFTFKASGQTNAPVTSPIHMHAVMVLDIKTSL